MTPGLVRTGLIVLGRLGSRRGRCRHTCRTSIPGRLRLSLRRAAAASLGRRRLSSIAPSAALLAIVARRRRSRRRSSLGCRRRRLYGGGLVVSADARRGVGIRVLPPQTEGHGGAIGNPLTLVTMYSLSLLSLSLRLWWECTRNRHKLTRSPRYAGKMINNVDQTAGRYAQMGQGCNLNRRPTGEVQ